METKEKTLREICNELSVTRRAVQGYEKAGLVCATGRNKYGHLLYDENARKRIATIKFYQQLGFQVKEIRQIIDAPRMELKRVLESRIMQLEKEQEQKELLLEEAYRFVNRLYQEIAKNKEVRT